MTTEGLKIQNFIKGNEDKMTKVIDLYLDENIGIYKSKIDGAGFGLFSLFKPIKKGDIITKMGGEYIYPEQLRGGRKRNRDYFFESNYVFGIFDGKNINRPGYRGRYANHSADPKMINSELVDSINNKNEIIFEIIATRDIGPHEEILWNYGKKYW